MSTLKEIEKKLRPGKIVFISDFTDQEDFEYENLKRSFARLARQGKLIRLTRGIYYVPKNHKNLGAMMPDPDQIARAIARRDKAKIIPEGNQALHLLGLSTQVPLNVIYLTDGSPRKIKIGNHNIIFKKTSAKNLKFKHPLSALIIQAFKKIGKEDIGKYDLSPVAEVLMRADNFEKIKEDMRSAPLWIRKVFTELTENHLKIKS